MAMRLGLLLCGVACALGVKLPDGYRPEDDTPATEEQLDKLEKMRHIMVCQSCEDVVTNAEAQMLKRIKLQAKSSQREIVAIEIVEQICRNESVRHPTDGFIHCENAVEKLEGDDDDLTAYIKGGKLDAEWKEQRCQQLCKWKDDMKNQISDMQTSMMDKVKKEEIDKYVAKRRQEEEERRANMTQWDLVVEEIGYIWNDLQEWWLFMLLTTVATVFLLFFIQVCVPAVV